MPAFYRIAKDPRLVLSTASGVFTLADAFAHQNQILADPDFNPFARKLGSHRNECSRVTPH
jgi:hypothetical protein